MFIGGPLAHTHKGIHASTDTHEIYFLLDISHILQVLGDCILHTAG